MKPRHESVGTCERDSFLLFEPRRGLWPRLVCGSKRKNECRALLNSPRRKTKAPEAVVRWKHITRIEVQEVCARSRFVRRTPIAAVRTTVVERRTIVAARSREENRVAVNTRCESTTSHAILISPLRVAVAVQLLEFANGRQSAW